MESHQTLEGPTWTWVEGLNNYSLQLLLMWVEKRLFNQPLLRNIQALYKWTLSPEEEGSLEMVVVAAVLILSSNRMLPFNWINKTKTTWLLLGIRVNHMVKMAHLLLQHSTMQEGSIMVEAHRVKLVIYSNGKHLSPPRWMLQETILVRVGAISVNLVSLRIIIIVREEEEDLTNITAAVAFLWQLPPLRAAAIALISRSLLKPLSRASAPPSSVWASLEPAEMQWQARSLHSWVSSQVSPRHTALRWMTRNSWHL